MLVFAFVIHLKVVLSIEIYSNPQIDSKETTVNHLMSFLK